jgi:Trk-type K+ transport system membrane component
MTLAAPALAKVCETNPSMAVCHTMTTFASGGVKMHQNRRDKNA